MLHVDAFASLMKIRSGSWMKGNLFFPCHSPSTRGVASRRFPSGASVTIFINAIADIESGMMPRGYPAEVLELFNKNYCKFVS